MQSKKLQFDLVQKIAEPGEEKCKSSFSKADNTGTLSRQRNFKAKKELYIPFLMPE